MKAAIFGSVIFTNSTLLLEVAVGNLKPKFYGLYSTLECMFLVMIPGLLSYIFIRRLYRGERVETIFITYYFLTIPSAFFFPSGSGGVHSPGWGYLIILFFGYPILMLYFLFIQIFRIIGEKMVEMLAMSD